MYVSGSGVMMIDYDVWMGGANADVDVAVGVSDDDVGYVSVSEASVYSSVDSTTSKYEAVAVPVGSAGAGELSGVAASSDV